MNCTSWGFTEIKICSHMQQGTVNFNISQESPKPEKYFRGLKVLYLYGETDYYAKSTLVNGILGY